jgi:hypothetical protein
MKEHAGQIIALAMVLAVVVILELHGNKDGGTIGELVAGAVGIAGAISGNRQPASPPPGTTTTTQATTTVAPQPPAALPDSIIRP